MVKYLVKFFSLNKWWRMTGDDRVVREDVNMPLEPYTVSVHAGRAGRVDKKNNTQLQLFANQSVPHGEELLLVEADRTIEIAMFTQERWDQDQRSNGRANASRPAWETLCNDLLNALGDGFYFVDMVAGRRAITLIKPSHPLPPPPARPQAGSRPNLDDRSAANVLRHMRDEPAASVDDPAPVARRQRVGDGGSAAIDRSTQTRELLRRVDSVVSRIIAEGCVHPIPRYAIQCEYTENFEPRTGCWESPVTPVTSEYVTATFPETILTIDAIHVCIYSTTRAVENIPSNINTVIVEYPIYPAKSDCEVFCQQLFSMLATGWFVHSGIPSGVRVAKYVDLNHSSRRLEETLRRVHEALDTI
jgi:hypothetical protein